MLKCAMEAGYVVEGIEPGPSADYIMSQFGIPVHSKTLSEVLDDLRFGEYGIVSYFHVLEHVNDPVAELLAVQKLLGEKGLLIIEVPFFDSLPWRILRSRHRHFYRGHRSYFNEKSMAELLRKTGFEMIKWESVPYQMTIDWLLMRLGKNTDILRRFLSPKILERLVRINTGEYLLVLAKRA